MTVSINENPNSEVVVISDGSIVAVAETETIVISEVIAGPPGDSAYEVAVAAGFAGTQTEWIASLQGIQGIQGENRVLVENAGVYPARPDPQTDPVIFMGTIDPTALMIVGDVWQKTDADAADGDVYAQFVHGHIIADVTGLQAELDSKADAAQTAAAIAAAGQVKSVNTRIGDVVLTKTDVGLDNVDNTSDVNKPVSTAQQNALNLKAPLNSPTFTGTVGGLTKTTVGLSNVDNTSDINKPVSTATQTALNGKAASTLGGAEKTAALSALTGTCQADCAAASWFYTTSTITGNITISPINIPPTGTACTITIEVKQGSTPYTVTMPGSTKWGGTQPTPQSNKTYIYTMATRTQGTTWFVTGMLFG